MLSREKTQARKLGIDRPISKFLNFLEKYYGLKDYVPQNNNFVVFKDYFIDEPQKRDKYDIYAYNSNSKSNFNNYDYNNNNIYSKNILTQRKLGKFNNNENISNNNTKNYEKEFTTKIYREYYNKGNDREQKEEKEQDLDDEYRNRLKQKKSFGYNQYQSSSSEYGAFFHMNK